MQMGNSGTDYLPCSSTIKAKTGSQDNRRNTKRTGRMAMHDRIDSEAAGRLLLIDRDAACAQTIAETLRQSLGSATLISVAAGGRQGADLLRERPFDIVLADLSSLADLSERSD